MKKFLLTAAVAQLTVLSSMAIDWSVNENLAAGKTVYVCSKANDAAKITDGNNGSNWQAIPGERVEGINDWAIIDLGETLSFTDVEIYWEAAHPRTYSIYLSSEEITDPAEYVAAAIQTSPASTYTIEPEYDNSSVTSEDLFPESNQARYILIYANEYNGFAETYGICIWEARVAHIEGRDEISSIEMPDLNVVKGQTATLEITFFNNAGGVVDTYDAIESITVTSSDAEAVEISETSTFGVFDVKADKLGSFTLKAVAEMEDGDTLEIESTLKVTINWNETANVAEGKPISGRILNEETVDNLPVAANDGDADTYYVYDGDWGGGDSWLIIDLENDYAVDAVEVLFGKNSGGTYCVLYGSEDAVMPEDKTANYNFPGWTASPTLSRNSNEIDSYLFETPVLARYIAVWDKNNPNGKPEYREVYVSGIKYEAPEATEITLEPSDNYLSVGEKVTLTARVYDQYGVEMQVEGVEIYQNGELINSDGNASFEITISDLITNYSFTASYGSDLTADCKLYVLGDETTNLVNDSNFGYKTWIDDNEFTDVDFLKGQGMQDASKFDVNNVLKIELTDNAADFDLIKIRWEAACPSSYTVTAVYNDNRQPAVVFSVEGRRFIGGSDVIDRIYSTANIASQNAAKRYAAQESSLSNVKALEILPTAKDHGYGLFLKGIEVYGAPSGQIETDVSSVAFETGAEAEYYTLDGLKVRAENLTKGIYVVRKGSETSKIIVK